MQNVHSPSPNAEYSANCPARKSKASPSALSSNASLKVLTPGASSVIFSIRIRYGRYMFLLLMSCNSF